MQDNEVMHQNVNCGRVELVGEAPIGLYIKLRKTRTFEIDVMQKNSLESFQTMHM